MVLIWYAKHCCMYYFLCLNVMELNTLSREETSKYRTVSGLAPKVWLFIKKEINKLESLCNFVFYKQTYKIKKKIIAHFVNWSMCWTTWVYASIHVCGFQQNLSINSPFYGGKLIQACNIAHFLFSPQVCFWVLMMISIMCSFDMTAMRDSDKRRLNKVNHQKLHQNPHDLLLWSHYQHKLEGWQLHGQKMKQGWEIHVKVITPSNKEPPVFN